MMSRFHFYCSSSIEVVAMLENPFVSFNICHLINTTASNSSLLLYFLTFSYKTGNALKRKNRCPSF